MKSNGIVISQNKKTPRNVCVVIPEETEIPFVMLVKWCPKIQRNITAVKTPP